MSDANVKLLKFALIIGGALLAALTFFYFVPNSHIGCSAILIILILEFVGLIYYGMKTRRHD